MSRFLLALAAVITTATVAPAQFRTCGPNGCQVAPFVVYGVPAALATLPCTGPEAAAAVRVTHREGAVNGCGSGVIVYLEGGLGLVITNRHVCPDQGTGPILVESADGKRSYHGAFVGCDDVADLAAVAIAATDGTVAIPLAEAQPGAGTPVGRIGFPGAGAPVATAGVYLHSGGMRGADPVFTFSLATRHGDSGSGIFSNRGVVGVTWGTGDGTRAEAVGVAAVRRFLGGHAGVRYWFPLLSWKLANG